MDVILVDASQDNSSSAGKMGEIRTYRGSFYASTGKRVCDLVLAILLSPVLVVPIMVLAILVKRDGGPAFFGHRRVGKGGKEFHCLKLRTMRPDAEAYLETYLAENETARHEWESNFKLKNDPRITRIGKFLRKTSLDELPQIFNVLHGSMSFVGPRPVPRRELEQYGSDKDAYLVGRPGITGAWQVSGRNNLSYLERTKIDARYRETESISLDIAILLKTPTKIIKQTGI